MEGPFRAPVPDALVLIETFARRDGGFVRLDDHLARLDRTAAALRFPVDRPAIDRALAAIDGDGALRVRLTLDRRGVPTVETAPLAAGPAVWRVAVHPKRLDAEDPWLRVKTSARVRYDEARAALPPGVDEWLFLNTRGEACEGTITNLFARRQGRLLTPPVGCGLLPGVLRAALLAAGAGEAVLKRRDLERDEILVGNSLRGLMPARLVRSP